MKDFRPVVSTHVQEEAREILTMLGIAVVMGLLVVFIVETFSLAMIIVGTIVVGMCTLLFLAFGTRTK